MTFSKKISPMEGAISTLMLMRDNILGGPSDWDRKDRFRETFENGIIVSTIMAQDTRAWETAITKDGDGWTVVEQYPDREAAKTGHDKWVADMKADPDKELTDIDVWGG